MNKELVESVLQSWNIANPSIIQIKDYSEETPRIVCRVETETQDYILKGIPNIPENTIKSNIQAYLFLGNKHSIAPKLFLTKEKTYYIRKQDYFFFLMECIEGRQMEETISDEYRIGQLTFKMHALKNYKYSSQYPQSKSQYYDWFADHAFKKEFDEILDSLPDFEKLDQCFVHTDIGPHNAMIDENGNMLFIDLDDSGMGSRYLDLGWPFIMQFVDYNHQTEEMIYRFDLAKSFISGYYEKKHISRKEFDLIFAGAIQTHISYMKVYGPDAVNSLWKILKFGITQKESLWMYLESQ